MLTKNQQLPLDIESLDGMMNGVAHFEGAAVFVPGALPGEKIVAQVVKPAKNYAFARIVSFVQKSPDRVIPPCPYERQCGGCSAMHMTYEATLQAKREAIEQVIKRVGGIEIKVPSVLPMDNPYHYRNKTAMPVSMVNGVPEAGFYAPRSHRLVPVKRCLIAKPESDQIAACVLSWMRRFSIPAFDEQSGQGLIRHILSRASRKGESMAVLVASSDRVPHTDELVSSLRSAVPGLVSICLSVNPRGDNVILGSSYRTLYGSPRLNDKLCSFTYALSPLSFFQINPIQTEKLYSLALDFASPAPDSLIVDLYCGAGTISLLLAKKAKRVIGIEIVPQAVLDAKENARQNNVCNVEFHAASAEALLPALVSQGLKPDIIVLDPPRKGAEPAVIEAIIKAAPARVVYVSCDPATLSRDLKLLTAGGYETEKIQPVDMFCWTTHVETVCLLSKLKSNKYINVD